MRSYQFGYLILFILIGFYGCTPKAATSSSTAGYNEDISAFRPKAEPSSNIINEDIDPGNETKVIEKAPYTKPSHDITSDLDVVLGNIAAENKNKPYTTYTVQVYTGRSREEANDAKLQVYRVLPDANPQIVYKQPKYKVSVGHFENRAEAYKTFQTLKKAFAGAMLIPQKSYIN